MDGESQDERFWELWRVWKRLILRFARDYAAEGRAGVARFARFHEWERE